MNRSEGNPRSTRPTMADACAVPGVRGITSWGAVLVAVLLTAVGLTVDGLRSGTPDWGFRVGFVAGVALAALLVRRRSVFTALVQPPLVMVAVLFTGLRLMSGERMTISLIKVVNTFPTMVVGTAVAVVLCAIRIFAQPLRRSVQQSTPQRAHV